MAAGHEEKTDVVDTLIYRTKHRRTAGLPAERLAVHVRRRFRRTTEKSRTTRVTKTRITGGRARKTLRQNRQEGKKAQIIARKTTPIVTTFVLRA
jgi:hypothetical protein